MKKNQLLLVLVSFLFFLQGCLESGSSSGGGSPSPGSSSGGGSAGGSSGGSGGSTTTSDVKKIVTAGAGLNFNSLTGSWSEMALSPTTSMPGVVYYDRSAVVTAVTGALKFAYMDSTGQWVIELVDANTGTGACGSATAFCIGAPNVAVPTASQPQIYDVKFLSTGQPVIAYAYGTTTNKVIRLAQRASDGTWTITTAVSASALNTLTTTGLVSATLEYAIKGIRLLVDTSDRVHLYFGTYAATTVTNSRLGYTMRKTDGSTWTTPVGVSSTTPSTITAASFVGAGVTFAAATGMTQAGAAWCKYGSVDQSTNGLGAVLSVGLTDNTPAASTQGAIFKCSAVDSDGACTTWNGLDFHNGCAGPAPCVSTTPAFASGTSNAFGRSDIAIDPTTGKIFLSTFYAAPSLTAPMTAATGIVSTHSPLACDTTITTAAWSTVRGHTAAAQGTLGLRVGTDGTNVYLASLVAAAGTSLTVQKAALTSGNMTANWNTSPDQVTVEATTNTVAGGFMVDATSGLMWGSYGALTAATAGASGQDLKVFNLYPGDINSTSGYVSQLYVDQTNFVFQSTAVPQLDAAIAPNGTVGYAYFYQEAGTAGPNSHLYYGIRGGTTLAPVFGEKLVSNSINGATTFMNGLYPSLAYDTASNPVIAFLDQGAAANAGYLMVATSSNGGATFTLDRVDGGAAATTVRGQYSSIKVSSNNTIGVAYYDYSAGGTSSQALKFAKKEKNGGWRRYVVDGPGSAGTNGCNTTATSTTGLYAQLKWTSGGKPVIVYQSAASGVKSLRLAYATEAESSSTYTWKCLTLDTNLQGSNVRGEGIDFYLTSSDIPHIAHHDQGIGAVRYVTCTTDVITCATTGASAFVGERLNYIVGSVTSISSKPSIRTDTSGKVYITFYSAADQGLHLATKTAGTSGAWASSTEALESPANGVSYANPVGQHAVMNLNSSGKPLVFYRSLENWVKYFSREVY